MYISILYSAFDLYPYFTVLYGTLCRPFGDTDVDEQAAGRDPEVARHVPRDEARGVPSLLLHLERRPARDPRPVEEPGSHPAAHEKAVRQHQEPQTREGTVSVAFAFLHVESIHTQYCSNADRLAHRSSGYELVGGGVRAVQEDAAARGTGRVLAEGSREDDAVRVFELTSK